MNVLGDFYNPVVLEPGHEYSPAGIYKQIDTDNDHSVSVSMIDIYHTGKNRCFKETFENIMWQIMHNGRKKKKYLSMTKI
jgi:hypothetical protein